MKKKLAFIYIGHFVLALQRDHLLFSFILKKTLNVIGASLIIVASYFLIKFLHLKKGLDLNNIRGDFYFIITFFMAILSSISKTSPLMKPMKEYLLIPFSLSNISSTVLLLSLFELNKVLYYLYILIIGSFIEISISELLIYLLISQVLLNFNILHFKKMEILISLNLLVGYLLYYFIDSTNSNSFLSFTIMLPILLLLTFVLFKSIKNKFNFK